MYNCAKSAAIKGPHRAWWDEWSIGNVRAIADNADDGIRGGVNEGAGGGRDGGAIVGIIGARPTAGATGSGRYAACPAVGLWIGSSRRETLSIR